MVGDRPIDEADAIGEQQMLVDEPEMMLRLMRGKESANDALRHGQQRVSETRTRIAWMQQQLGPLDARSEKPIASDRPTTHKMAVEV